MANQQNEPHRVGLIGAGEVVRRFFVPALRSRTDIEVSVICSLHRERANEVAGLLEIPTVVADHESLLDDDRIESVLVCTPPHSHFEIARAALMRGRNVLLEKPPCRTYQEFASLQALAARCGRVLDVTFSNAAREDNAWLVGAVQEGRIGAVRLVELQWLRVKPRAVDKAWTAHSDDAGGGGVLADLGSHLLRISVSLIPQVRRCVVFCNTSAYATSPKGVEDIACANILADDAVQVTLTLGWGMQMKEPARVNITAHGDAGSLSNRDYPGISSDGYANLLDRFVAHARAGRQLDLSPVDRTMQLVHGLYESSRLGSPVTIELSAPHTAI